MMLDISDSANIEIHTTGVRSDGALLFSTDVVTFLTILQYRRGMIPKSELILKYPFWEGGYYGD